MYSMLLGIAKGKDPAIFNAQFRPIDASGNPVRNVFVVVRYKGIDNLRLKPKITFHLNSNVRRAFKSEAMYIKKRT